MTENRLGATSRRCLETRRPWSFRVGTLDAYQVTYCSGDMHAGFADQRWLGAGVEPVKQRGHANTASVLKWVKANFPKMGSFVLGGSSAGALAVQWWARPVLEGLQGRYEFAAVIADSYSGVGPKGIQPFMTQVWRLCDTGVLQDHLNDLCRNGSLTVQDTYVDAMQSNRNVTFSSLSSKSDAVQIRYYNIWVALHDPAMPLIGGARFYADLNTILRRYNQQPNYVSYLVNGGQHTFFDRGVMLTTSPAGEHDRGATARPLLTTWLRRLAEKDDMVSSVCFGAETLDWAGALYCDAMQANKTVVPSSLGPSVPQSIEAVLGATQAEEESGAGTLPNRSSERVDGSAAGGGGLPRANGRFLQARWV